MNESGIVSRHPLWDKPVDSRYGWADWLERWHKARNVEDLLGLLHGIFAERMSSTMKPEQEKERVTFLLCHADGWLGTVKYAYAGSADELVDCPHRTAIAGKAFEMLAAHTFRRWVECDEPMRGLEEFYQSEDMLPILLTFFGGRSKDGRFFIRNIGKIGDPRKHASEMAEKFLLTLIDSLWRWEQRTLFDSLLLPAELEKKRNREAERKARLDDAKLWGIEVLNALRKIRRLGGYGTLGERVEQKVEEIALRDVYIHPPHVRECRLVKDFDEALKAGSEVAWFLFRYRKTQIPELPRKKKKRRRSRTAR